MSIPDLFAGWVRRTPSATALVHGARRITYRELDVLAAGYLNQLRAAGVRPGDIVATREQRTIDTIAALLATLRAGAAYSVLDPRWPPARQRAVLDRLAPRVVVTGEPIEGHRCWQPDPPGDNQPGDNQPGDNQRGGAESDPPPGGADPAVIFFTSGSTGVPKAVVVPHQALTRLFLGTGVAAFGPGVVQPQSMPMHWDGSILDLWGSLLCGGTSVLVDDVLEPGLLRALVREHRVNALGVLPTAVFNMLVDEDVDAFCGLRFIGIGGERASGPHLGRFLAAHPDTPVTNLYGPAECGVLVTTHRCTVADADDPAGVPIGRPAAESIVLVLAGDRECGPNETGELCLGGDGLALGYLGAPELTAERFVTLPVNGVPTRLYRSGDLGYRDGTGLFHYTGRDDGQIKIRSHRIEPGEIERTAERVPGIARCAVVALRSADGTPYALALYYVAEVDHQVTPEQVRAVLAGELPSYLLPRDIRALPSLPLSLNGKVDREALQQLAPAAAGPAPTPAATTPGGPGSDDPVALLSAAFQHLTGVRPAPDDNFFALGASSLDAARLCARINAALDVTVPVSQIYRTPTVGALAGWLNENAHAAPVADAQPATGGTPLTIGQAGTTFSADTSVCQVAWWLDGPVDQVALAAALADVHQRHETLRAHYRADDPPTAEVPETSPAPEFARLTPAGSRTAGQAAMADWLGRPMDIGAGEIWRAATVECGGELLFGIGVHHVAFDGWSQALLIEELGTAYAARIAGGAPRWPYPAAGLAELAEEERRGLTGVDLAGQLRYWLDELRVLRRVALPGLRRGQPTPWGPKVGAVFPIPVADLGEWEQRAGTRGGGRFAYHAAILAEALRQVTGQSEIGLLVPVARRGSPRLDTTLACRTDPVVLRMRRSPRPDADPVAVAAATINAALAAQDIPFGAVVRGLIPLRPDLDSILTLPTFVMQDNENPVLRLAGCTAVQAVEALAHEVQAALTVEVFPEPASAAVRITVRTDLIPAGVITELGETYLRLLHAGPRRLDPRAPDPRTPDSPAPQSPTPNSPAPNFPTPESRTLNPAAAGTAG